MFNQNSIKYLMHFLNSFKNENTGVVYTCICCELHGQQNKSAGILLRCEIGWPSEALPEFTCEGDVHIIAFNLLNERMLIHFIWTNTGLYITDSLSRTKQRWRRQCKGVKMISSKALRELSCDGDVHINGFQLARWKIFRELHRLLQKLIYPLYNLHLSSLSPVCEIGHNKPGAINAIYLKVEVPS